MMPSMAMEFGEDGYLSYDSEKAMFQQSETLRQMGYKEGDMLWKPGTRDELNGRILTGRVASISSLGNYIPEYEHESANSAFLGSGNRGFQGRTGLGADQADENARVNARSKAQDYAQQNATANFQETTGDYSFARPSDSKGLGGLDAVGMVQNSSNDWDMDSAYANARQSFQRQSEDQGMAADRQRQQQVQQEGSVNQATSEQQNQTQTQKQVNSYKESFYAENDPFNMFGGFR